MKEIILRNASKVPCIKKFQNIQVQTQQGKSSLSFFKKMLKCQNEAFFL